MDDAEEAYKAAKAEIAREKEKGGEYLSLDGKNFHALRKLPPEIMGLTGLKAVSLGNTQISDLVPLAAMTELQRLTLHKTQVSDLSPLSELTDLVFLLLRDTQINNISHLAKMSDMEMLDLSGTAINDITPLENMRRLVSLNLSGTHVSCLTPFIGTRGAQILVLDDSQVLDLRPIVEQELTKDGFLDTISFQNTPATTRDARLAELAEIEDNTDRTRQTLDYLRSLPPWPDPYTPAATPDGSPPKPIGGVPDAPDADKMPKLVLTPDHRIDLEPVLATDAELADPIRKRLYERLPKALDGLLRYSNRYPELDSPARALRDMIAAPFEEADFLFMHLEIDALTDVKDAQASLSDAEQLDTDCLTALVGVLRIAPPITMGHPDIELLEERGREYQRSRIPDSVADAESRIARGLENHELATPRTQEFARRTAAAGPTGRVAEIRRGFSKNTILIMFFITEQATNAALGHVFDNVTVSAAQFLLLHKDAILATAPTWGHSGFAWTQYVMIRAQQIVDSASR